MKEVGTVSVSPQMFLVPLFNKVSIFKFYFILLRILFTYF